MKECVTHPTCVRGWPESLRLNLRGKRLKHAVLSVFLLTSFARFPMIRLLQLPHTLSPPFVVPMNSER